MDSRFNSAALSGTRIERNTTISNRNDSDTTTAMNHGSRSAILSDWSMNPAVGPPTSAVARGVGRRCGAAIDSRSRWTRSLVAWSCGLLVGMTVMSPVSPAALTSGGETARTPGSLDTAATIGSSTAASGAVAEVDHDQQWSVEPVAEPGGEQVVGTTVGGGRRVGAGVGLAEPHVEHRDRQRHQHRGRGDRAAPGVVGDPVGPAHPAAVLRARSDGRRRRGSPGRARGRRRTRAARAAG